MNGSGMLLRTLVVALCWSLPVAVAAAEPGHGTPPPSFADIVQDVIPAVVNISTTQTVKRPEIPGGHSGDPMEEFMRRFFDQMPKSYKERSLGSGVIISPDGDMLAIVDGPGEAVISASIDIDRLRWRKTRVAASGHSYNPTVLCRADLYAREYQKAISWPTGAFADKPLRSTKDCQEIAAEIIARQIAAGRLRPPSEAGDGRPE